MVYVETLKGGKEKTVATIVDKDKSRPLKGVLVLEAWAPADQSHMRKHLQPHVGKVTTSKIQSRGRTLVYFDVCAKIAYDTQTNINAAEEDVECPKTFPELPDIKHASSITSGCMISVVAAVVESGQAVERPVPGGAKKYVTNLKNATGNTEAGATFW